MRAKQQLEIRQSIILVRLSASVTLHQKKTSISAPRRLNVQLCVSTHCLVPSAHARDVSRDLELSLLV